MMFPFPKIVLFSPHGPLMSKSTLVRRIAKRYGIGRMTGDTQSPRFP